MFRSGSIPNFLLPAHSTQHKRSSTKTKKDTAQPPASPDASSTEQSSLWTEKYAPQCEEELAIRTHKLKEMKFYIESSAISPKRGQYKMLVLTGPTGAGKSTAIRVMAKAMNYDLVEWENHQQLYDKNAIYDSDYEPTMKRFSQFLQRSIRTSTLSNTAGQRPKIILLDDLPDLTTRRIKQEFQQLVKTFVSSKHAFLLVVVHSDAQMVTSRQRQFSTSSSLGESHLTTLDDIATKDIRLSGRCGIVEFNPIIKKNLKATLSHILRCEANISRPKINQLQLDEIIATCRGDIRCAILTMQFYAVQPTSSLPRKRKASQLDDNSASIEGREGRLDFFHAMGKVLYAKRLPDGKLESKPVNILDNFNTDSDNYLGHLYSNYHQMAPGIDNLAETMNHLCEADVISSTRDWSDNVPFEYQLLISMHSIMAARRDQTQLSRKLEYTGPGERYYKTNKTSQDSPHPIVPIVTSNLATVAETDDVEMTDLVDEDIEVSSDDEFDGVYTNAPFNDDHEFDDVYDDNDLELVNSLQCK